MNPQELPVVTHYLKLESSRSVGDQLAEHPVAGVAELAYDRLPHNTLRSESDWYRTLPQAVLYSDFERGLRLLTRYGFVREIPGEYLANSLNALFAVENLWRRK
jgi:hypothetical protein